MLYPLVTAENGSTLFAVMYGERIVPLDAEKSELVLVNGARESRIVVDFGKKTAAYNAVVFDCTGSEQRRFTLNGSGIMSIDVPVSGVAILTK